tara:strand:+ start:1168 stop:1461 length:294 start_codon:yes stop_codon:yes gene_type:complete
MDEREFIRDIMDDGTHEHIQEAMPREMGELAEFGEMARQLAGKVYRRTRKIKQHMMTCEYCLNRQMELGLLMPIEDFYTQGQEMGMGRLPKLHHMKN